MKILKNSLALVFALLMLVGCFTACEDKPTNDDKGDDGQMDGIVDDLPGIVDGDDENGETPDDGDNDDPTTPDDPNAGGDDVDEPIVDDRPINPLTGLHTDYDVTQRPVAIMFNNIKKSLPQSGISEADVYYEAIAEGNITRVMGLYLDATHIPDIGSIRSTRLYFLHLAMGHDSILVHAGQSAETKKYMVENNIFSVDATTGRGEYFYRNQDRIANKIPYEHTLFLKGSRLLELKSRLSRNGYRFDADPTIEHFYFNETDVTPEGKDATEISVPYVNAFVGSFSYDEETGLYTKYQYGSEHYDELYDTPIKVKNVIILYSDMSLIEGDEYGRSKVDFTKGGTGLYISNGKAVEITWTKPEFTSQLRLFNKDDMMPLYLNKGKSYFCLVGNYTNVTYS